MISSNTLAAPINPLDLYTKTQLCSISANMWSRPATALLIEMYRKLDCLWKTDSMYYRNKKRRYDALQEIATAIGPFRPDTTIEDVKNKINGIRTQYAAEKNKISFFTKKCPSMLYEPSLWCYDRLSFLASYTFVKNSKSSNEEYAVTNVSGNARPDKHQIFQVKIETDDDIEINDPDDINPLSESNEECDSSQTEEYINDEPSPKKARSSSGKETFFIPSLQPEVTLTRSLKYRQTWPPSDEIADDEHYSLQSRTDESVLCAENDDWIEVFGKFVTTQMKLINDKTLLMKLQHTIQNAIMDTQLKQIELEKR